MTERGSANKMAQGRFVTSEQVEHITVTLPHDDQDSLVEIAKKRGISLAELLREAIPQGLKLFTTAHSDEFERPNAS
jgi:hypothetical protein